MLPEGYRWRRHSTDRWYMQLLKGETVVASVHLSPGKAKPYSLAYTAIGSWRMGGHSYNTRMAAIRACERWAVEFEASTTE